MKLFLLTLTAAACMALPILPTLDVDGLTVDPLDPRIGQHVYVLPESAYRVRGNDNEPPGGDNDYNDAVADIFFNVDGSGYAAWVGENSVWVNHWLIEGQVVDAANSAAWGALTLGTALNVVLVTQDGSTYATGTRNVLVDQVVPEPGTWALFGVGLAAVGLLRRGR